MCFKIVILERLASTSFFSYSVNWAQLPTGIGQCFFVIMTELAMRRYIPGLSDRQSNKAIIVPFSNSFVETLNIHMPHMAKDMQEGWEGVWKMWVSLWQAHTEHDQKVSF